MVNLPKQPKLPRNWHHDPKSDEEAVFIADISPEQAEFILAHHNTANFRGISEDHLRFLAKERKSSRWGWMGDTITFLSSGVLLNGQNRLQVTVDTGRDLHTAVVFGINKKYAPAADGGIRPRTLAQWLKHRGVKSAEVVAGAANLVHVHDQGHWGQLIGGSTKRSHAEVANYVCRHGRRERFESAARVASRFQNSFKSGSIQGVTRVLVAAMAYLGCPEGKMPEDDEYVDWYFRSLATGESITKQNPVYWVRQKLIESTKKGQELTRLAKRGVLTIGWNRTVAGDIVEGRINFRFSGPKATKMPSAVIVSPE